MLRICRGSQKSSEHTGKLVGVNGFEHFKLLLLLFRHVGAFSLVVRQLTKLLQKGSLADRARNLLQVGEQAEDDVCLCVVPGLMNGRMNE